MWPKTLMPWSIKLLISHSMSAIDCSHYLSGEFPRRSLDLYTDQPSFVTFRACGLRVTTLLAGDSAGHEAFHAALQ